jgi:hypothetical protein
MNRQVGGAQTAAYWRELAKEARAKGEAMRDAVAKGIMLEVAQKYELLAELAARREGSSG